MLKSSTQPVLNYAALPLFTLGPAMEIYLLEHRCAPNSHPIGGVSRLGRHEKVASRDSPEGLALSFGYGEISRLAENT